MSTVRGGHKPLVVLSFISWELRHRNLRSLLAQALHSHPHFSDGYILNAIEADASEEMGGTGGELCGVVMLMGVLRVCMAWCGVLYLGNGGD